jgi:hypothetical protein
MSAITNVWRQLVQRRLWPVAILLIAALAAVPLALAQQPEPVPPAPPVAKADTAEAALETEPIVAQATAADRSKRRKVLGHAKNPFGLPKSATDGSAEPPSSTTTTVSPTSEDRGTSSGSSGETTSPGGGSQPTAPAAPTEPAQPPVKTYDRYDLTVRFGDSEAGGGRTTVKRLQPLPSAEEPVLIYLGVLSDGKTAVFLVKNGVVAVGDGECKPSPESCETIRLRAGETQFIDVKDETGNVTGQYQLDLLKIHKGTTASASKARASSKAGARLLKARVSAEGPIAYRWNAATGTLERRAPVVGSVVGRASARLP